MILLFYFCAKACTARLLIEISQVVKIILGGITIFYPVKT